MKSLKAKSGVIIKIPVKDDVFVYAQLLEKGCLAIFDCFVKTIETKELDSVIGSKVIFSPTIFDGVKSKVINKGVWQIVGMLPIKQEIIEQLKPQFHFDNQSRTLLYYDGTTIKDANPESFYGLFPISVYDEHNVQNLVLAYYEDRYADYEISAFFKVYFKGEKPYGLKIPKFYYTMSRSRAIPKPDELEGEEKKIWEETNNKAIKEHYELMAKLRNG